MSKPTPGPWTLEPSTRFLGTCNVWGAFPAGAVCGLPYAGDTEKANAHLMAAAPEMLAALERIFELTDYACGHREIRQIANDAIRKAKGET